MGNTNFKNNNNLIKENDSLEDVRKKIKEKNYDKKRVIYIDEDIAKILNQLKFEKKIPMGDLCSYLLEQFIEQHKEEVTNLFKNRFI
ncbi:MAG: hypothetical protein KGV44_08910 [Flavobacteriaceae bacterium]|nr:hypothetical protein [Flavobacteriaceae bacterium]